jgi:DNA-binding NarL/FixJ family response regulator
MDETTRGVAMARTATVIVVEDEARTRRRFAAVVASNQALTLAGVAGSLVEATALLDRALPDLVLLDLGLPDGTGVSLIHRLAREGAATEVLVISVMGDEASVMAAIEAGASGYLLKDASDAEVLAAIQQVFEGGAPLSPSIAVHLMRRLKRPARGPAWSDTGLTPREAELLRLIAKGLTYDEVADVLGLRYNTVASYAKVLYRKLHVHSRAEAIYEAMQMGLVGGGGASG